MSSPTISIRQQLLSEAQRLCHDFASGKDILPHFSTSTRPVVIEYGNPFLTPFLGREFLGLEEIQRYFHILAQSVKYDNMEFVDYIIDVQERKVVVKGRAVFTWIDTEQSWDETFIYVLQFDSVYKLARYEVWADSGAAYLARIGRLHVVQES